MEELVKLVAQKTGISHDQAQMAVETVLKFVKERLPAPIAGQIDGFLSGSSNTGDILKNVGGLFGQK